MSSNRRRKQVGMPKVLRVGTQRRMHPASPSATPKVRRSRDASADKAAPLTTPENPSQRRQH